jgi:IclR family transcriptional regulator, acetate operon repressor
MREGQACSNSDQSRNICRDVDKFLRVCEKEFMISKPVVRAAVRTMDVFETFKEQKRPLSLSEIADEINTPISTCHEIVRTLRDRGYLYVINSRSFYPTGRIVACARAIAANDPIVHRLAPALERLRDATGETVILGKLQSDHVVYLAIEEGLQTIRYSANVGDSKPLHSSSIGKATLAQLDEKARAALLSKLELPQVTPNTIDARDVLEADLEVGRRRGFFVTRGENVVDVMGMAVAIDTGTGPVGIAVAGPLNRMEDNFERNSLLLLELSRELASKDDAGIYRSSAPLKSGSSRNKPTRQQVELK